MLRCAKMLHQSLLTVAPRVVYFKHKKPGQELPHCGNFAKTDAEFCRRAGLDLEDLQAFKPVWAASSEGRGSAGTSRASKLQVGFVLGSLLLCCYLVFVHCNLFQITIVVFVL